MVYYLVSNQSIMAFKQQLYQLLEANTYNIMKVLKTDGLMTPKIEECLKNFKHLNTTCTRDISEASVADLDNRLMDPSGNARTLININQPKFESNIGNNEQRNIMDIIEKDDRNLLENNRIADMTRNDWGKALAVPNQYIQRNMLRDMLSPFGYSVYSTDDTDMPEINIANNSPGFDLVVVTPENEIIRVQSKLRQVKGIYDYSQQIHFETTRRNSEKNKDKNHTGHICYSLHEFDLVMISLVNDRLNRNKRKNCNLWTYSLISIKEIEDTEHNCCYSHIKPEILQKNIIKITDDIRSKF